MAYPSLSSLPSAALLSADNTVWLHRLLAEWRAGQAVYITIHSKQYAVAAAETITAPTLGGLLHNNPSTHLVLSPERWQRIAGLGPTDTTKIITLPANATPDFLASFIDPTRTSSTPSARDTAPILFDTDTRDILLSLIKSAGLLPAFVVAPSAQTPNHALSINDALLPSLLAALQHPHLQPLPMARLPLAHAPDARVVAFRDTIMGHDHLAILIGDVTKSTAQNPPLVRLHSSCITGDVLGSLRCDCGTQLHGALDKMHAAGSGILLYLHQEGRNIGLGNKMRAYRLQDTGLDTIDANHALGFAADERNFALAATMLRHLNHTHIRLLTNNPEKATALTQNNIHITEIMPHFFGSNPHNDAYLKTKRDKAGHLI